MVTDGELSQDPPQRPARELLSLYVRVSLWYLLIVGLLSALGFESIYLNPTPFHALYFNASESPATLLLAVALMATGTLILRRIFCPERTYTRKQKIAAGIVALGALILYQQLSALEPGDWRLSEQSVWAHRWTDLQWHLPVVAVFFVGVGLGLAYLKRVDWFRAEPDRKTVRWLIAALIGFSILFASSVAMVRGGSDGISDAYSRSTYEYIGDVGKASGIRTFLRDYNKMHPYLSMHSKVHPPGPIVILWLMSYIVFSVDPLALSMATIVVGSTALIPLFLWVRDLFGTRVALTCAIVYSLMPSIVLFTATSADILFMPLTLWTLFFFWRAIHRSSFGYALAGGAAYALLSLCSFSHLTIGAFFAFVGLWRLREAERRIAVIQTAILMVTAFFAVHIAVRYWSGFDVIECFRLSKAQFDEDQINVQSVIPRYPAWTFRILNPLCWFFFAGIPVSLLFLKRLLRPESGTRTLFAIFALTLLVLDLLYLARGEGERSAMYVLPFVVIPAAHFLDELGRTARSLGPLIVTCGFLAFQTWAIEAFLYTYW